MEVTLKLSGRKESIRENLEKVCSKEGPPQCKDLDVRKRRVGMPSEHEIGPRVVRQ